MDLQNAVLGVIPTFGNSAMDITMAVVLAVLVLAATAWMLGASWTTTHHHRPH